MSLADGSPTVCRTPSLAIRYTTPDGRPNPPPPPPPGAPARPPGAAPPGAAPWAPAPATVLGSAAARPPPRPAWPAGGPGAPGPPAGSAPATPAAPGAPGAPAPPRPPPPALGGGAGTPSPGALTLLEEPPTPPPPPRRPGAGVGGGCTSAAIRLAAAVNVAGHPAELVGAVPKDRYQNVLPVSLSMAIASFARPVMIESGVKSVTPLTVTPCA